MAVQHFHAQCLWCGQTFRQDDQAEPTGKDAGSGSETSDGPNAAEQTASGATAPTGFTARELDASHSFYGGRLPDEFIWDGEAFDRVWDLHPDERHKVEMYGKMTAVKRWQQAYGARYRYTGSSNEALPIPQILVPLLLWAQITIDHRLNGLLLNWYDGPDDRIGPHHDSTIDRTEDSPIVTVSFGEERVFRLTKWDGRKKLRTIDFSASDGDVFVTPWDTNAAWKH